MSAQGINLAFYLTAAPVSQKGLPAKYLVTTLAGNYVRK